MRRFRPWFYVAALYNLAWGAAVILFPRQSLRLLGLPPTTPWPIWQVVGMLVLVYAPGYWWAARDPQRHRQLIAIGLLGKLLGPIGYLWAFQRAICRGPSAGRSSPPTCSGGRPSSATCEPPPGRLEDGRHCCAVSRIDTDGLAYDQAARV